MGVLRFTLFLQRRRTSTGVNTHTTMPVRTPSSAIRYPCWLLHLPSSSPQSMTIAFSSSPCHFPPSSPLPTPPPSSPAKAAIADGLCRNEDETDDNDDGPAVPAAPTADDASFPLLLCWGLPSSGESSRGGEEGASLPASASPRRSPPPPPAFGSGSTRKERLDRGRTPPPSPIPLPPRPAMAASFRRSSCRPLASPAADEGLGDRSRWFRLTSAIRSASVLDILSSPCCCAEMWFSHNFFPKRRFASVGCVLRGCDAGGESDRWWGKRGHGSTA